LRPFRDSLSITFPDPNPTPPSALDFGLDRIAMAPVLLRILDVDVA